MMFNNPSTESKRSAMLLSQGLKILPPTPILSCDFNMPIKWSGA